MLNRLVLDPSKRPIALARDLGITRSAVSQIWRQLEQVHNLSVRGMINYGELGLIPFVGLFFTQDEPLKLREVEDWLRQNPFVVSLAPSAVTASMESILIFETVFPLGPKVGHFRSKLAEFQESLSGSLLFSPLIHQGQFLNLGRFNGTSWNITDFFRLEAVIHATKDYVDIIPENLLVEISSPSPSNIELSIVAVALEKNYFANTREVLHWFEIFDVIPPSDRTIRRRINEVREKIVTPYVHLTGLNLAQRVALVFKAPPSSDVVRTLIAQLNSYPRTRVAMGNTLTMVYIDLPSSIDWFAISTTVSVLDPSGSILFPFVISEDLIRKGLEGVVQQMIHSSDK
ncbi:MAG: hypothetical protein GF411_18005 [Candidatus Lokiarchaeota archaeon]|nr:hypothetical protein [Candidatus Lokiarchaeota archaeon]